MSINVLCMIILLAAILIVYPFIHKYVKRTFSNVWVWMTISIFMFIYAMYLYIDTVLINGIFGDCSIDTPPPEASLDPKPIAHYFNIFGDASFTAICNFIFTITPLMIIFQPSRKIATFFAPIGFLAGFGVLIMYATDTSFDNSGFFTNVFYTYYGSVFKHFLVCLISYLLLFNSPKFIYNTKIKNKWHFGIDAKISTISLGSYFIYVFVISQIIAAILANLQQNHPFAANREFYNCSGLYSNDFRYDYSQFYAFRFMGIEVNGKTTYFFFPLIEVILMYLVTIGMPFIFNKIKNFKWFEYKSPQHFYKASNDSPKWYQW